MQSNGKHQGTCHRISKKKQHIAFRIATRRQISLFQGVFGTFEWGLLQQVSHNFSHFLRFGACLKPVTLKPVSHNFSQFLRFGPCILCVFRILEYLETLFSGVQGTCRIVCIFPCIGFGPLMSKIQLAGFRMTGLGWLGLRWHVSPCTLTSSHVSWHCAAKEHHSQASRHAPLNDIGRPDPPRIRLLLYDRVDLKQDKHRKRLHRRTSQHYRDEWHHCVPWAGTFACFK